ncbi:MAG TPA: NADH-quinone oxidoreductase subunit NuoN [Acetobacteraceae bacterium]|nr:NADH-quinone oxidoreductase subunit NuoN [Acetobacteraceae bacterium]
MNWQIALPEIVLSVLGMAILIYGVLRKTAQAQTVTMLCIGALLITGFLEVTRAGGVGYNGQYVVDAFAVLVKELVLVGAAGTLILSLDYNRRQGIARFEFPVLILFATVGMMGMASASNLIVLYLTLELQSLCSYVLAASARDELRSAEAGLKYFVLSSLASGLLLYGISLAYGFSGTMDFRVLAGLLASPASASAGAIVGVVFILVGLAFKIAAAPFHMWTPDVYEGAPTPVTAFFATAPKIAAMALFLRTMAEPFGHLLGSWRLLIEIISVCSMILGALAAIGQSNIKRLLAYSSIGHMGYALIGLAAGGPIGMRGVLIYLITYIFMALGTFGCVLAMRRRGAFVERIEDLSGLARTDPALALAFAVFMFSMAGIPPLSGFFAKLYVFLAAVQQQMWVLAVIGVLTSVISSFYYLRIVKVIYFDPTAPAFDPKSNGVAFVATVSGLFTLFFLVFSGPFVGWAGTAAAALFG